MPVMLVRWAARRFRGAGSADDARRSRERDARTDRMFATARITTIVLVLLGSAVLLGIVIWNLAAYAAALPTLGRFLGVTTVACLLTSRAHRVVE